MKDFVKKLKKEWKNNPVNILVPVISVLAIIIGTLAINFKTSLLVVLIIDAIYYLPGIIKKKRKSKKNQKYGSNKEKEKLTKNNKKKKWLLIIFIAFISLFVLFIAFCIFIVASAPKFDPEELYSTVPTVLYDKNGNTFAKLGSEKRVLLDYDEIPEVLIDAIVATEDSRFFKHNGVDWARFIKASAKQLLGNSDAGGASTLTMQLSKNTYTSTEASGIKGIIRKFTDVYISMFQIEKNYTKEEIMEFYVNSNYLGYNSYGVEQASITYFNKSAKDLNVAEAAMIAGLFQAPSKYDPYENPEGTEKRRQTVLSLMLRHGYITEKEYDIAKQLTVEKIVVPKEESSYTSSGISKYQSFIDQVVSEVKEKTGHNPYTTSMEIYTTMDPNVQEYVTDIMNGKNYTWENDQVQAGVAITNTKTGAIVALGGGRNINAEGTLNHATQIKRQIGSTAKPLYDYGPAIEYLNWNTYGPIVDEQITYSDGTKINNWDGRYQGMISIRTALAGSRNIPALKAFQANNKSNIIEFVTNLGLSPEIYSCKNGYTLKNKKCVNNSDENDIIEATKASTLHEAHSIGGYTGENPLSMASAYAAFSNGGTYIEPYSFTKLTYQVSGETYENEVSKKKAMSEETAYMISDMLVTTSTQALGRYSNVNGIKYAAKTGTTNFDDDTLKKLGLTHTSAVNDLWVVGYNTEYSIGVWYGYDKNSSKYYNTMGSGQHSKLFQTIAKKVFTSKNTFKRPSGVVEVTIEKEGPIAYLPSEYTPDSLKETALFVSGTEPTAVSERFAKLKDVTNVYSNTNDNEVTLSWKAAETPKINTESYLREYYKTLYKSSLNSFISSRLSYNKNVLGDLGYSIYEKDQSGKLTLIGFTTDTKYTFKPTSGGTHTYIVKTSYSKFKSNMSDGKSVTVDAIVNEINSNETACSLCGGNWKDDNCVDPTDDTTIIDYSSCIVTS